MKLLIHTDSLKRVGPELRRSNFPLEIFVVGIDGAIRHEGNIVDMNSLCVDAVWVSLDAFIDGTFSVFFSLVLNNRGVKWMQTFNAGLDFPIFEEIVRKGIRLTNSSAQSVAIAEYVMGQVLAEWYPTANYRAAQAKHEWRRIWFRELSQSSWLIIGYGHIGAEIAQRAKAFGARVVGVRRSATTDSLADEMGTLSDLGHFLPDADIVVLAAALNKETRDLVSVDFLSRMKAGSILVNIGRGGLVDEDALVAALDRGIPSVAILDVFREEPLPATSPLWDHPNIRISSHTSPAGSGTLARGDRTFLDNLPRFVHGEPMFNEVDASFF